MTSSYGYETVLPPLSPSSYLNFDSFSGSGSASASSSSRASSINGGGDEQQQQQQQQFGNALLSPGIVDDGSSSLDLFKYYLDMQQSQQQKEQQQPSTSAGAMQTISMADIEQFNALFAGSGGVPAPDASAAFGSASSKGVPTESVSYFSFGGDSVDANSMSTSPALPPSAFETATSASSENFNNGGHDGSDMPVVPGFLLDGQIVPKIEDEDEEEYSMHHYHQQAALSLPPVTVAPPASAAPVPATQPKKRAVSTGNNKRRAISQTVMDDISEGDEDGSQQQLSDEDDEDDMRHDGPGLTTKKGASRRAAAASSSTNKKASSRSTKAVTPSASAAHGGQSHPHALVPVPEYEDRPSKEEYEKLSSKEKRQLRNKISARNFRHRRKAHIDTLEAEINERDGIIDVLKEEVGTLRSENTGLRADIEMLKKNWESIASKISATAAPVASTSTLSPRMGSSSSARGHALSPEEDDLYGSASLPALSPPSSSASTNGDAETEVSYDQRRAPVSSGPSTSSAPAPATVQRRSTRTAGVPAPKPNYRKDLSAANGSSFWDTTSPFSSGFRGAGMDVHTTFVPEISLGSPAAALSEKKESGLNHFGAPGFAQMQERAQQQQPWAAPRMNMNPALNGLTPEQINALREQFVSSAPSAPSAGSRARSMAGKDQLVDVGDRSFFDANPYLLLRNDNFQDYRGQLYSKLANNVAGIQATRNGTQSSLDGLRPAYFASPSAPPPQSAEGVPAPAIVEKIAVIAQKTLLEKMTSAFWDAFAGEQPSPKSMVRASVAKREMDPAKVAAVLSGKSSLQVVPNPTSSTEQDGLQEMMGKLDLQK